MIKTKKIGKKIINVLLIVTLFFVISPFLNPNQIAKAVGIPFGGRLLFFSPPIITLVINCPALVAVTDIGPTKGIKYFILPPGQPRSFYNYFTPGVAVLGNYIPTPIPFNCVFQPIFPTTFFGTSAR
jgi:hypothetical protein